MSIKDFIIDYCQRHAHPVNAVLHIIGVPVVFYGLYFFVEKKPAAAFAFIALGYFFQYLGHRAQGNEVGEVTLIKKCISLIINKSKSLNPQPDNHVFKSIEIRQEEEVQ